MTSLAPSFARAWRFPLAYLVLATEDQQQGNPVDWRGLRLVESRLRNVPSSTIRDVLEV